MATSSTIEEAVQNLRTLLDNFSQERFDAMDLMGPWKDAEYVVSSMVLTQFTESLTHAITNRLANHYGVTGGHQQVSTTYMQAILPSMFNLKVQGIKAHVRALAKFNGPTYLSSDVFVSFPPSIKLYAILLKTSNTAAQALAEIIPDDLTLQPVLTFAPWTWSHPERISNIQGMVLAPKSSTSLQATARKRASFDEIRDWIYLGKSIDYKRAAQFSPQEGPFIQKSKENILEALGQVTAYHGFPSHADPERRPKVLVLGAGHCREIPIEEMVAAGYTVILNDVQLEPMQLAHHRLPAEIKPFVQLDHRDFTGGLFQEVVAELMNIFDTSTTAEQTVQRILQYISEFNLSRLASLGPVYAKDKVAFVVSSMVLTQFAAMCFQPVIGHLQRRYPETRNPWFEVEYSVASIPLLNVFRYHVQLAHLQQVAQAGALSYLSSEVVTVTPSTTDPQVFNPRGGPVEYLYEIVPEDSSNHSSLKIIKAFDSIEWENLGYHREIDGLILEPHR